MSRQTEKSKKRNVVKNRKIIRLARKKKQAKKKRLKDDLKILEKQKIYDLAEELSRVRSELRQQIRSEQESSKSPKPSFNKSSWQTSTSSNNISHGSVRSAVLNRKTPEVGFSKTAWGPVDEEIVEEQKLVSEPTQIFNQAAWIPPDAENTKEITSVDSGECSQGTD